MSRPGLLTHASQSAETSSSAPHVGYVASDGRCLATGKDHHPRGHAGRRCDAAANGATSSSRPHVGHVASDGKDHDPRSHAGRRCDAAINGARSSRRLSRGATRCDHARLRRSGGDGQHAGPATRIRRTPRAARHAAQHHRGSRWTGRRRARGTPAGDLRRRRSPRHSDSEGRNQSPHR